MFAKPFFFIWHVVGLCELTHHLNGATEIGVLLIQTILDLRDNTCSNRGNGLLGWNSPSLSACLLFDNTENKKIREAKQELIPAESSGFPWAAATDEIVLVFSRREIWRCWDFSPMDATFHPGCSVCVHMHMCIWTYTCLEALMTDTLVLCSEIAQL